MKLKNNIIGASLTFSPRFTANFTQDELTLKLGDQQHAWPIVAIAGIEFVPGLIWASARITTLDGQKLQLDGIDEAKGIRWHAAFMALLYQQVASAGNQASIRCARWLPRILKQLPDSWHPSWMGNHLAKTTPPETLPCGLTIDQVATHPAIKGASEAYPNILPTLPLRPTDELNAHLRQLNEAFFEQRKTLPLFDTLEATPLTEEQRRGVICFDSHVLLIAAAGSGKTATMVAKAAYAISTGIVKPAEILMLAFNADAAEELQHRLEKRLVTYPHADQIACRTFHSFGLSVIGDATGIKPNVINFGNYP